MKDNSKKIKKAIDKAMKELFDMSNEEYTKKLNETEPIIGDMFKDHSEDMTNEELIERIEKARKSKDKLPKISRKKNKEIYYVVSDVIDSLYFGVDPTEYKLKLATFNSYELAHDYCLNYDGDCDSVYILKAYKRRDDDN